MSTLVIVQARFGSTRLPNKVRASIGKYTMLEHVVQRAVKLGPTHVAFPPPHLKESDVLGRFADVAKRCPQVETFVRVTADCPMLDVGVGAYILNFYRTGNFDYVGTAPEMDGLDVEVFSRVALREADLHAHGRAREHVTPWMKRNLHAKVVNLAPAPLRWSVDDESGLDFVRRVFAACPLCHDGVPRHTNAGGSIGGVDRTLVLDLHQVDDGGLAECTARDILQERVGGESYESPITGTL